MLLLINLPQKTHEAVSNVQIIHTVSKKTNKNQLNKSKVPRISYPYSAKLFKRFFVKLLRKSRDLLLLLGVTNIILVLKFMEKFI